jgi:hypothetical protein
MDPGYYLSGGVGTVVMSGTINTNAVGNYYLYYTSVDTGGRGGVTTVRQISVKDTIAPTLSFPGGNTITREIGNSYTDPLYTITDNYWTGGFKVIINTGALDTQNLGTYIVWYTPVDPSGNTGNSQGLLVQLQDTTPPTINFNPSVVNLRIGDTFDLNSGVTVSDNYWTGTNLGYIINGYSTNSTFSATNTGTSTITYQAYDNSEPTLITVGTRTINVLPAKVIENVIGTYYEEKGQYQYVRYTTGNEINTVINKTP